MERSDDAPLEQRPDALDTVGVHVSQDPLLNRMVNGFMASIVVGNPQVGRQFVGVDSLCLVMDCPVDEVVESVASDVGDAFQTNVTVPLDGPSDPGLVALEAPSLAPCLAAYQGFVHFDHSEQRRAGQGVVAHGCADAMAEIPGGLVSDSQSSLDLEGRHALLGLTHEVDSHEPLAEG